MILRRAWVAVTDPLLHWGGRARCVLFDVHGRGCRGRRDHSPYEGRWIDYRLTWWDRLRGLLRRGA